MKHRRRRAATVLISTSVVLLATLGLAACGRSAAATDGDGGDGGHGSAANDGGAVDAGLGDGGGEAGTPDGGTWRPPPTASACVFPAVGPAFHIDGGVGGAIAPALTWDGTEAGLGYAIPGAPVGHPEIMLQRLAESGKPKGAPIDVGSPDPGGTPQIAVASDNANYLVCVSYVPGTAGLVGVRCLTEPQPSLYPSWTLVEGAAFPAIATGPSGYLLAFREDLGFSTVWLDASNGAQVGNPQAFRSSFGSGPDYGAALVRTSSGYVAVTSLGPGTPVMNRLDITGKPVGSPEPAAGRGPFAAAMAGSYLGIAWVDATNDARVMTVSPDGSQSSQIVVSQPGTASGSVAIAAAGGAFAVSWADVGGFIGYRAVANDATPLGSELQAYEVPTASEQIAFVAVGDGFLLATTLNGGAGGIDVVHLGCP